MYKNGKIAAQELYNAAGKKNGITTYYNESGKATESFTYRADVKNGAYTAFYPSGKISTKGNYKNDLKEGEWLTLDETTGIPTEKIKYEAGKEVSRLKLAK